MKILAIVATLLLSAPAFADLYLEPYLGYETGEMGSPGVDLKGSVLGAKLGYSSMGFAIGADYMMGSLELDTTPTTDVDTKDLGIFAQFTFPILIKVGVTYFMDSKADTGGAVDLEGSGTKIGVGFTGLPFVAINLDMININYDKPAPVDTDRKTYLLSVSLPLSL